MDLIEPLPSEHQAMINALPEDKRQRYIDLIAMTQRTRVAYGFPANPPEPLGLMEMKEGEIRNGELATKFAIDQFRGTNQGSDWFKIWMDHSPNHFRDLPNFAYYTINLNCWTPEQEIDLISWAWTECEWPEANLGTPAWRGLWKRIGFVHEYYNEEESKVLRVEKPTETVTLYRGAIASRKRGMAWTDSKPMAEWFAKRFNSDDPNSTFKTGRLWVATVTPNRLYARFDGRKESEYVINTRGLKIEAGS